MKANLGCEAGCGLTIAWLDHGRTLEMTFYPCAAYFFEILHWQAQCLVSLDYDACFSVHCKKRFICVKATATSFVTIAINHEIHLSWQVAVRNDVRVCLCTTVLFSVLKTLHYTVLLQYYTVSLQYYKELPRYGSVLQSSNPVLLCATKYYSNSTLYYKILLQYYKALLQCYSVLQSNTTKKYESHY